MKRRFDRRTVLGVGGSLGLATLAGCSELSGVLGGGGSDAWPMYQGGPKHRGVNAAAAGPGADPSVRWRRTADELAGEVASEATDEVRVPITSPPVVVDDTVYAALSSQSETLGLHLVALDAGSGTLDWQAPLLESFIPSTSGRLASPTVADGTVVVAAPGVATDASAIAVHAASGEERWRDTRDGERSAVSAATARDGEFTFGGALAHTLGSDGDLSWEYTPRERGEFARVNAPPTVTADGAYVPTNRWLVAIDGEGERRWVRDLGSESDLEGSVTQPRTPAAGDLLYVPTGALDIEGDGRLVALDPSSGETQWEFKPAYDPDRREEMQRTIYKEYSRVPRLAVGVYGTPALHDGTLYAPGLTMPEESQPTSVPRLFAIDAATGERQWATRLPDDFGLTPPVVAGGTVHVATTAGLTAIDATSGDRIATRTVTEGYPRGLAVVGDALYTSDGLAIAAVGP